MLWKRLPILTVATLVMLGAMLAGCLPAGVTPPDVTPAATDTPPPPKPTDTPPPSPTSESQTLVVGLDISECTSMDPHAHFVLPSAVANYASYDSLVKITADDWTNPVPSLAESWQVSDDGLVYTFHLRSGVKFSSGNPLTAEDVRFSWMRLKNKEGPPSWFMGWVESVEAVDDLTVKVTLLEPSAAFLNVATVSYLGVMDSKVVREHGGADSPSAATADEATVWLDQNSAGSGPFVLKEWVRRTEIVLEANPNYWGEKPNVDRIVIRHVEDPTAAFQMVRAGDMDLLLQLDPDLIDDAKAAPNLKVEVLGNLDVTFMTMTCSPEQSEALSDPRVRKAIDLSLDRDGLIAAVLGGYAVKPPSILPVGMEGVEPGLARARDLEEARTLLREAGFEDGFTETLAYPTGATWDVVAAKIQSDLADVGITVELNPMDISLMVTKMWEERALPWYVLYWVPDYIDYTIWTEYWSHSDHDFAHISYCEIPELEETAKVIASEIDPEKRLQAVEDWQRIMMDYAYSVPLYQQNALVAMSKDLEGFRYIPVKYTDWAALSK